MKIEMKITFDTERFITIIRCLPEAKSGVKNRRFAGAQIGEVIGDYGVINR